MTEVFALLDDAHATAARPSSRLYTGWQCEHRCVDPATLDAWCEAVQRDLDAGLHAVLLADYEWGAKLLQAGHDRPQTFRPAGVRPSEGDESTWGGPASTHELRAADDASALRALVFQRCQRLDADAVTRWLAEAEGRAEPSPAGVCGLHTAVDRPAFDSAIARIHEAIADGETYQVNYTVRWHGRAWGTPLALYRRLRERQRVAFGALIRLPMAPGDRVEWVLSRSPELFVRHEAGQLTTKPMKGTAARASAPESDSETARLLHDDVKNRAENLMIVDLLRNDLGRIAELGSVQVPELFAVEPYATVFQMTSTVTARRRPEVGLAGLLRAVFPCGSITGAPKHQTMRWISRLEPEPRGLYTGAIGWLQAGEAGAACPDLCLSVAIRTLVLGPEAPPGRPGAGTRALTLGVGGGIVQDSVAADEHAEVLWKARFLTTLDPGIALFETMRLDAHGVALRQRHRARLQASAAALGFRFEAAMFELTLDEAIARLAPTLAPGRALRLRLALAHDGALAFTHAPLLPLPPGPVGLRLAETRLPAARPLAGHKSTAREAYDAGIREAEAAGAFDTLFLGPGDELVEGGRTNVFVKLDGRWRTPPLADGVLPGVMRGLLLEDPAWQAVEQRLTLDDLRRAEGLAVTNALRGALRAVLPGVTPAALAQAVLPRPAGAAAAFADTA